MAALLADAKRRNALVKQLVDYLDQRKLDGVVVDIESLPESAMGDYGMFLRSLTVTFKPHGWIVVIASPVVERQMAVGRLTRTMSITRCSWRMTSIRRRMRQGRLPANPGSEHLLDKRMKLLNPAKTIVALGYYAYDWNGDDVDSMAFEEAVIAAHDSDAKVEFDDATNNPHFSYVEDDGTTHNVWLLDAVTAYNQIHAADHLSAGRLCFVAIGQRRSVHLVGDGQALWRARAGTSAANPGHRGHRLRGPRRNFPGRRASTIRRAHL